MSYPPLKQAGQTGPELRSAVTRHLMEGTGVTHNLVLIHIHEIGVLKGSCTMIYFFKFFVKFEKLIEDVCCPVGVI